MLAQTILDAAQVVAAATRPVSLTGAGLSAESGLSTFRNPDAGLWARHDLMRLASVDGFREDPRMVVDWYNTRRLALAAAAPNPAHVALAQHPAMQHVTQNVDNLLERAGVNPSRVIHVHGRITMDRCHNSCGWQEEINLHDPPNLRQCPVCASAIRPAVVWFGESLPHDLWSRATEAVSQCDVLLVIGTSAVVYPAAGLIDLARTHGARIIVVNIEPTTASDRADFELIGPAGEIVPRLCSTGSRTMPNPRSTEL